MNRRQAYERALRALGAADTDQMRAYAEHGDGWGNWDTSAIRDHIQAHLAFAFGQGPEPEPLTAVNDGTTQESEL